jgi:hypothetical protein
MARRDQIRDDSETVHVWVIRTGGTVSETAVRAHLSSAKEWVEDRLGDDGAWDEYESGARYDCSSSPDYAKVDLRALPDAIGLIVPTGA